MSITEIFDDGNLNRITTKALGLIMPKLSLVDLNKVNYQTDSRHKRHLKTCRCYLAFSVNHNKLAKAYYDEQKQKWMFFDGQRMCPSKWFIEAPSNRMEYLTHIDMSIVKKLK
ncbi:MAG: hypothetical protein FVQ84_07245 [Planctomycetes bacterium]|nr:hypothetical protein [Planctomycetota bacterium]